MITRSLKLFFWILVFIALAIGALIIDTAPEEVDLQSLLQRGDDYQVRIIRDNYGVPHIYGERDQDTAFGLAYAHAEDDFATIQDVILATRGTLAAVKGPDAAKTDYLIRLMRVWNVVDNGYQSRINQHTRDIAEAYADGINLFAAQHPERVAPYLLPVVGKDLIAGFTFKTPLFYGFDKKIGELFDSTAPRELAKQGSNALTFTTRTQAELGSQGIAIAPGRSSDGATRLLVNSHQPLTGPVAWYEARLHSNEGWDMVGSTFPGAPVIIHGHNRQLGWANTVNKPDLVDVYRLTLNPDNPDQYLLDGQWRDFDIQQAEILVKLLGPIRWRFTEPLYFSAHGPVLKLDHGSYALRWAGMDEMRTLEQMIRLNKAQNITEFEDAMAMAAMPSINYIYADAKGNIAHYYNAMIPQRLEGWDWSKDLPGDRSELIWNDYLPFEQLPITRNPPSGFVFNANNTPYVSSEGAGQPTADQFSSTLGIETGMTNRALRLKRLLSANQRIDDQSLNAIKYDVFYDESHESIIALRELLARDLSREQQQQPQLKDALNLLAGWNLSTDRSNRAAALGVLTISPLVDFRQDKTRDPDLLAQLLSSMEHLQRHFGRLDPEFGEFNRLQRGDQQWPLDGGPDIVRAVYGDLDPDSGKQIDVAGDSYILFATWDREGEVSSESIHNFGSATLNSTSPHYADQSPLFAEKQHKPIHLELEQLLLHAERDYRP